MMDISCLIGELRPWDTILHRDSIMHNVALTHQPCLSHSQLQTPQKKNGNDYTISHSQFWMEFFSPVRDLFFVSFEIFALKNVGGGGVKEKSIFVSTILCNIVEIYLSYTKEELKRAIWTWVIGPGTSGI